MIKKVFLTMLVLLLVFSVCVPVGLASDEKELEPIQVLWTYLIYADNDLTIGGLGLADVWSEMWTTVGTVDNVRMSIYLQRYNGSWTNIKHWSSSADGTYDWFDAGWYVTSGYTYRVKTYYYAYDGDTLVESTSKYSGQVYY